MTFTADMPRRKLTFRIDERLLELMDETARGSGHSKNLWLERHLTRFFADAGKLPDGFEPLGDLRGERYSEKKGDRTQSEGSE